MKDGINLFSQNKKMGSRDFKEFTGSFWSAVSVFSKKLRAWTRKHRKMKKHGGPNVAQVAKKINACRNNNWEAQSEMADYGFGWRSCHIDPRFSLDPGRFSFDTGRISLDAGQISLDDPRKDNQTPVEDRQPSDSINKKENSMPGGAKNYYSYSFSRRRNSLDRSSYIRMTAAAVVAEMNDMKSISNAKVCPAAIDYFHGAKAAAVGDRELKDSNSNWARNDCCESIDMICRDNALGEENIGRSIQLRGQG
ncbi:hypothetical protein Nepgr_011618 [Nepenthes gracilis]|uniref:Uncharacterized protein n=1 Tax=Nepenthes gracilis TaxID=150966 RepID=A0AAD3XM46_NEPGR|nr:hypothetical protein Nepgr_011618 [Nepenthes gracilis]